MVANIRKFEFICNEDCPKDTPFPIPRLDFFVSKGRKGLLVPQLTKQRKVNDTLIYVNGQMLKNDNFKRDGDFLFWEPEITCQGRG